MPAYPSGYSTICPLTVTNGNTVAISGSVVVGTVPTTSTDYVVQAHVTGATAGTLWSALVDKTGLTDYTVWWNTGTSYVQLDIDPDTKTNGAWSATQQTAWFKLQAPIAASGTDSNYIVAVGNSAPIVMQNWGQAGSGGHIYPFADDFLGTTLASQWHNGAAGAAIATLSLSGSVVTLTNTSSANGGIASYPAAWGIGYEMRMWGSLPPATATGNESQLEWRDITSGFGSSNYIDDILWDTANWKLRYVNPSGFTSGSLGAGDSLNHLFTHARLATTVTGSVDGVSTTLAYVHTQALAVWLYPWAGSGTAQPQSTDWIKVRPYAPVEPVVVTTGVLSAVNYYLMLGIPDPYIPNYSGFFPLTVYGGATAVSGSTTVPKSVTSTDYVIDVSLTGTIAAQVYAACTDTINFTDLTLWWIDSTDIPHQIDIDQDKHSHGAWSASNIFFRFCLQQPLAAYPAFTSSYIIVCGNSAPIVMQNWANIYPLQDDYLGSTLDNTKWHWGTGASTTPNTASVSGSILTISSGISGSAALSSLATFPLGYKLLAYGTLGPIATGMASGYEWRDGAAVTNGLDDIYSYGTVINLRDSLPGGTSQTNNPFSAPIDSAYHYIALARGPSSITGWLDAQSLSIPLVEPTAFPVTLYPYNGTGAGSSVQSVDWVKVSPWIASEPYARVSGNAYLWTVGVTQGNAPRLAAIYRLIQQASSASASKTVSKLYTSTGVAQANLERFLAAVQSRQALTSAQATRSAIKADLLSANTVAEQENIIEHLTVKPAILSSESPSWRALVAPSLKIAQAVAVTLGHTLVFYYFPITAALKQGTAVTANLLIKPLVTLLQASSVILPRFPFPVSTITSIRYFYRSMMRYLSFIATGGTMFSLPVSNSANRGEIFSTEERVAVSLDFTQLLSTGETIASVASVQIIQESIATGLTDVSATLQSPGSPLLNGNQVIVLIGNPTSHCIPGAFYTITITIVTNYGAKRTDFLPRIYCPTIP